MGVWKRERAPVQNTFCRCCGHGTVLRGGDQVSTADRGLLTRCLVSRWLTGPDILELNLDHHDRIANFHRKIQ